ncbi:hypothetical protein [Clostridium senegalense]|uniref:hypothetical protein n=1 Tax=Clostridium senegalense TaxID=1465809 RepID=UPI001C120B25|nr:hypothetical protein [Clostridium senegalense]MBU5227227.1 hypothetical protein [Clostridium senegalense]
MKRIKLWSDIFLWIGRILMLNLIGLFILLYCIPVPSEWYDLYRAEFICIKNMLLIFAPFSLIVGYAIKSIYNEMVIICKKIGRKVH